jgi:hypothetical protein
MCRAKKVLCKPYRIGLVLGVAALLSAWTCTAVVNLNGFPDAFPHPQIGALSPNPISADIVSVVLSVEGTGFVPQSESQWNKNTLPTIFIDSRHLQATVTQQTFASFGGSAGSSVMVSVVSPGTNSVVGCPNGGTLARSFSRLISELTLLEVDSRADCWSALLMRSRYDWHPN